MDPNANFRERIALATDASLRGNWGSDRDRFDELTVAYAEWRANGGFVADRALRDRLLILTGHRQPDLFNQG